MSRSPIPRWRGSRVAVALVGCALGAACDGTPAEPVASDRGLPGPSLSAQVETIVQDRFPLVNTVFNVCTGEWVDIEGEFLVVVRQVLSSSGRSHFRIHVSVHVEGTGQSTGTGYVSNEQLNLVANGGSGGASVFVLEFRILTVSKGSAANAAGRIRAHVTVNAVGEVTVDRFEFVFDECRG